MIKKLSRIDYKKVGRICSYSGYMGDGLTLAAVRHVISLHKQTKMPIVSNIPLYGVVYKALDLEMISKLHTIENHIILLDNVWLYLDNRRTASKLNKLMTYNISIGRVKNNKFVLTCHHNIDIDLRVRRQIATFFHCRYPIGALPALQLIRTDVVPKRGERFYHLRNVDDFFKYYSTTDMPSGLDVKRLLGVKKD